MASRRTALLLFAVGALSLTTPAFAQAPREINVLFIGNSYTRMNNLPDMLSMTAASDESAPFRIDVDSVTNDGKRLKDLWDNGEALRRLHDPKKHWDYVVLQEQSLWATNPEWVTATYAAVKAWNYEITKASARTVLFETWARQPGSNWYMEPEKDSLHLGSAADMQQKISDHTSELARSVNALEIPVGDYWALASRQTPPVALYDSDGSHPTQAGTYLAALIFYRYLTGKQPDCTAYVPPNMAPALAKQLANIASRGLTQN